MRDVSHLGVERNLFRYRPSGRRRAGHRRTRRGRRCCASWSPASAPGRDFTLSAPVGLPAAVRRSLSDQGVAVFVETDEQWLQRMRRRDGSEARRHRRVRRERASSAPRVRRRAAPRARGGGRGRPRPRGLRQRGDHGRRGSSCCRSCTSSRSRSPRTASATPTLERIGHLSRGGLESCRGCASTSHPIVAMAAASRRIVRHRCTGRADFRRAVRSTSRDRCDPGRRAQSKEFLTFRRGSAYRRDVKHSIHRSGPHGLRGAQHLGGADRQCDRRSPSISIVVLQQAAGGPLTDVDWVADHAVDDRGEHRRLDRDQHPVGDPRGHARPRRRRQVRLSAIATSRAWAAAWGRRSW